nr:alpha-N-acetylglucosaminidase-like isoform X2 [Tanacetum cinerariifolium]
MEAQGSLDHCIEKLELHVFAAQFPGNVEMYGVLDSVGSGPVELVGVGMSMEGIEQNSVVYDLMSEMAF